MQPAPSSNRAAFGALILLTAIWSYSWIVMKQVLADQYPDDLSTYGLIKDAATDVLMLAAEEWAARTNWVP